MSTSDLEQLARETASLIENCTEAEFDLADKQVLKRLVADALRTAQSAQNEDTERLDWLLTGKQHVSPQAGWDGTQGEIRVMREMFASEDGAFVGHKTITSRSAIDQARREGK